MPAVRKKKCTCVYATSRNDKAVRDGISMGGFLKRECQVCIDKREAYEADAPKRKRLRLMDMFREDYAKADPAYVKGATGGLDSSRLDPSQFLYTHATAQFKLWLVAYERGLGADPDDQDDEE